MAQQTRPPYRILSSLSGRKKIKSLLVRALELQGLVATDQIAEMYSAS